MRVRVIGTRILMLLLGGCSQPTPTLAGGKPVSYWLQALHDPDAKLRKKAVNKLGNVAATDPAVVPALIGALHDRSPAVRSAAIVALLKSDPIPTEAVTLFADLQSHDRNTTVRTFAREALAKISDGK